MSDVVTTIIWAIDWFVMIGAVILAVVVLVIDGFDVFVNVEIDFGWIGNVGTMAVVWLDLFHEEPTIHNTQKCNMKPSKK